MDVEARTEEFLKCITFSNELIVAFFDVVDLKESNAFTKEARDESVRQFAQFITQETSDRVLRTVIRYLFSERNAKKVETVAQVLEQLAGPSTSIAYKSVCEAVLQNETFSASLTGSQELGNSGLLAANGNGHENVNYENGHVVVSDAHIRAISALLRRFLPAVDYKGVRDILRTALEKTSQLSANITAQQYAIVRMLHDLVRFILDRSACLLPAYLAVNEITKLQGNVLQTQGQAQLGSPPDLRLNTGPSVHWTLANVLTEFVESFRAVTQMVSIVDRASLVPIVGFSTFVPSATTVVPFWRLTVPTLRFNLQGPLPYSSSATKLTEPQTGLLRALLLQSGATSRDWLHLMLNLSKTKLRIPLFDDCLADTIVECAYRTHLYERERERGRDLDPRLLAAVWRHVTAQLTNFVVSQTSSYHHVIDAVRVALIRLNKRILRQSDASGVQSAAQLAPLTRTYVMMLALDAASINSISPTDLASAFRLFEALTPQTQPVRTGSDADSAVPDEAATLRAEHELARILRLSDDSTMHPLLLSDAPFSDVDLDADADAAVFRLAPVCLLAKAKAAGVSLPAGSTGARWHAEQAALMRLFERRAFADGERALAALLNFFASPQVEVIHAHIWDSLNVQPGTVQLPHRVAAYGPTRPLSFSLIQALSTRSRSMLILNLIQRLTKHFSSRSSDTEIGAMPLSPAFVESLSRLLIVNEHDPLRLLLNSSIGQLVKSSRWPAVCVLFEVLAYRVHYALSTGVKFQLLAFTPKLASSAQFAVCSCVEQCTIKLVSTFGSTDTHMSLFRFVAESKALQLVPATDLEETNKLIALNVARAVHLVGIDSASMSWLKDLLTTLQHRTPHSFPSQTLAFLPTYFADTYQQSAATNQSQSTVPTAPAGTREDKHVLKRRVDAEYAKWKPMLMTSSLAPDAEEQLLTYFSARPQPPQQEQSQTNPAGPLLLTLLFRTLRDGRLSPLAVRLVHLVGPRHFNAQLRALCDYFVAELSATTSAADLVRSIEVLEQFIWQYAFVSFEKFVLFLLLRPLEPDAAQFVFLTVYNLLCSNQPTTRKPMHARLELFVRLFGSLDFWNSPSAANDDVLYARQAEFDRLFPERSFFDVTPEDLGYSSNTPMHEQRHVAVYYSNPCLRFLPVLDTLIHRVVELYAIEKQLVVLDSYFRQILETYAPLYAFHDRPLAFLYSTLHYYERRLAEKPPLRRLLTRCVLLPLGTAKLRTQLGFDPRFVAYLADTTADDATTSAFVLDAAYCRASLLRIMRTVKCDLTWQNARAASQSPSGASSKHARLADDAADGREHIGASRRFFEAWRLTESEYQNRAATALYAGAIELMSVARADRYVHVVNAFVDAVSAAQQDDAATEDGERYSVGEWMNALGLLLAALPEPFWSVLLDRVRLVLESPAFAMPSDACARSYFSRSHVDATRALRENDAPRSVTIALCHAVFTHAAIRLLSAIPQKLRETVKPAVRNEMGFLFVCELVGPFLVRLHAERTRSLIDIVIVLYELLDQVDKSDPAAFRYVDTIADFLYHVKYMFVGDAVREQAEPVIRALRCTALQSRLRFIAAHQPSGNDDSVPPTTYPPSVGQSAVASS